MSSIGLEFSRNNQSVFVKDFVRIIFCDQTYFNWIEKLLLFSTHSYINCLESTEMIKELRYLDLSSRLTLNLTVIDSPGSRLPDDFSNPLVIT